MRTTVDEAAGIVIVQTGDCEVSYPLQSAEGFAAVSRAWVRAGWDAKYSYGFSWFGRPMIQLPEDVVRIQELIWELRPDVIIETGVAHGGSLVFYASLFEAMGCGRVIGIDIEIRPQNRAAIESHPLAKRITLIEGNSVGEATIAEVRGMIAPHHKVLVILDSNHSKAHVLSELENYAPMVSVGSYIVATDGIMEVLAGAPRSEPDWTWNNPKQAAAEFAAGNLDFVITEPTWPFNEGVVRERVTHWPGAYLKRLR